MAENGGASLGRFVFLQKGEHGCRRLKPFEMRLPRARGRAALGPYRADWAGNIRLSADVNDENRKIGTVAASAAPNVRRRLAHRISETEVSNPPPTPDLGQAPAFSLRRKRHRSRICTFMASPAPRCSGVFSSFRH